MDTSTTRHDEHSSQPEFGHSMLKYFQFDPGFRNLNHGSFGTYPVQVRDTLRKYQALAEARPDVFIRYEYPSLLDRSRNILADYLKAPVDDLVFVPNATTAINTILRNLRFQAGDLILYYQTIYGACEKTVAYVCETTAATSKRLEYDHRWSDDEIVQKMHTAILNEREAGHTVRVAIFDVVSSLPGVRMPFERLTEMCKHEHVLTVIDGAHCPGQVDVDLGTLQPDFFFGNCHKWLFAPRGCAVLYVPKDNQSLIRTSVPTSHYFIPEAGGDIGNPLPSSSKSNFVTQFEFVGAIDGSPYLCIEACFDFIQNICGGFHKYQSYCQESAREGGSIVAHLLGTETMTSGGTDTFFSNVRLPLDVVDEITGLRRGVEIINRISQFISLTLAHDYNTFLAIAFFADSWWVRLSGQIYLEREDFEFSGNALREVVDRVRARNEFLIT